MATFKAVVLKHQERKDGKFPVSIRIIQNRRTVYMKTGLYCAKNQISKKTFEIKDQFILMRTGQTIAQYEKQLLSISTDELLNMSAEDLKKVLSTKKERLDYLGYCRKLIEKDKVKWAALISALNILDEMGIKEMYANDFTSNFIFKFKNYIDNRTFDVTKNGTVVGKKHYKVRTKNSYLIALCQVFRMMQKEYNTEFHKVITHDPFIGFEYYKKEVTAKRTMPVEELRQILEYKAPTEIQQTTIDILKMSFCMCGINILDIVALEPSNYDADNKRINYERRKTKGVRADNAFSSIRIEPEIEELVEKYMAKAQEKGINRLFYFGTERLDRSICRNIGMTLNRIIEQIGVEHVSPYWFRHTWATIARNECNISKDDIDLCLNHVGQNKMADVYIKTDWSRIDNANRKVLDFVFQK